MYSDGLAVVEFGIRTQTRLYGQAMFAQLRQFIDKHLVDNAAVESNDEALQVAAAVMLVEAARADFSEQAIELESVLDNLRTLFRLSTSQAQDLLALAQAELDAAVCLHQFTQTIKDAYTQQQRIQIIELMWKVAFADGRIDRYEEHLIRKIADLLYVSHQDYINAKNRVAEYNS